VSDIFQEVDEEVRRERLKRLWDRYGLYFIALAVLLVASVGAWRGYQWWEAKKAAEAGASLEVAIVLSDAGKHKEAEVAFAKIASEAPAGYRMLARFREAGELSKVDVKAAVARYDALAADDALGQAMQDLAALRAAMLLVDTAPFDDIRRRLEPVAEPARSFRHTAREILALSAWRGGDATAAKRYIDMIAADTETPAGTRSRADVLSALMAGNGKS
jgi:hypothetical protein